MAKRGRSGDPAKRRYWRELVERWRQSGQSVRAFCRSGGVKEAAFYWWRQRLAQRRPRQGGHRHKQGSVPQRKRGDATTRQDGPDRHVAARFLPVQVVMDQASESSSGVEIHWDNGRSVRLCRRFDRQTLADVMAVLETRPC
jgi:transposase-like protein